MSRRGRSVSARASLHVGGLSNFSGSEFFQGYFVHPSTVTFGSTGASLRTHYAPAAVWSRLCTPTDFWVQGGGHLVRVG
jgi:hypothetical protein